MCIVTDKMDLSLVEYMKIIGACITETDLRLIFTKVVEGMSYLHKMGVMHRDIKPGNIMINLDEKNNIIDL